MRRCANAYPLLLLSSSLASGQRFPCGRAASGVFLSPAREVNAIRTVVATELPGAGVNQERTTWSRVFSVSIGRIVEVLLVLGHT